MWLDYPPAPLSVWGGFYFTKLSGSSDFHPKSTRIFQFIFVVLVNLEPARARFLI